MNEKSILLETAQTIGLDDASLAAALEPVQEYGVRLRQTLLEAHAAKERYGALGIDMAIWRDTMEDIAVWCINCMVKNGVPGLENTGWLKNHIALELFRLGRLQYQLTNLELPEWVTEPGELMPGLPAVYIHIPQGAPLAGDQVDRSLALAGRFLEEHFPCFADAPMVCESWLLYPGNSAFMREDANIRRFASRFRIVGSTDDPAQAIERIWMWPNRPPEEFPEDTSLQRSAKRHLLSGGRFGEGFGLLR
ncbi:MAG: hypothetical protein E7317_10305 [Clostridiales bacterium]|nr:hypothetical protein [Clostridiales bacterium]